MKKNKTLTQIDNNIDIEVLFYTHTALCQYSRSYEKMDVFTQGSATVYEHQRKMAIIFFIPLVYIHLHC